MRRSKRTRFRAVAFLSAMILVAFSVGAAAWGMTPSGTGSAAWARGPAFTVSVDRSIRSAPVDGRLLVIVSRSNSSEPRLQADDGGVTDTVPFWGKDVHHLWPGQRVHVTDGPAVYGYPLARLSQLPAGDYWVQALLNVYTTFHRSDGSVVSLHLPCGDGNDPFISPGNLVSQPVHVRVHPGANRPVPLRLTSKLPQLQPVPRGGTCQQGNPPSSAHVKHLKIKSPALSRFWGQPMYIGADVLLPRDYATAAQRGVRYPVIWHQTHFPSGKPFGFTEDASNAFSKWWLSAKAPRVLVVEIRHENPYFDDSYAVNSANLGPYGTAITKELMPDVARHFRTINHRWASTVTGGSTGGWETIAQQVFYPTLYSGAWIFYPDPLDFHFVQVVDVYDDPNAYFQQHDWVNVPRPSARATSGDTLWTMAEENHWELALGTHGRSGLGQWDIWQAVYGPPRRDGYPAPIWDKRSGAIHHQVATAWKPMDLDQYLTANWNTLGPQLSGRMNIFVGTQDTFFLNDAVQLFQQNTDKLTGPKADISYCYGLNQPHGFSPYSTDQLVTVMARYMAQQAPAGTSTNAWLDTNASPEPQPAGCLPSAPVVAPTRTNATTQAQPGRATTPPARQIRDLP